MVNYAKMSLPELQAFAKEKKIRYSGLRKDELRALLEGGIRAARAEQKKARRGSKKGPKVELKPKEAYSVAMKKKCKPTDVKYVKNYKNGRNTYLMKGYCNGYKVARFVSEDEYNKYK